MTKMNECRLIRWDTWNLLLKNVQNGSAGNILTESGLYVVRVTKIDNTIIVGYDIYDILYIYMYNVILYRYMIWVIKVFVIVDKIY